MWYDADERVRMRGPDCLKGVDNVEKRQVALFSGLDMRQNTVGPGPSSFPHASHLWVIITVGVTLS